MDLKKSSYMIIWRFGCDASSQPLLECAKNSSFWNTQARQIKIYMVHPHALEYKEISFTFYPAHSSVGRGNLMLKHPVPHFLPNFKGWVLSVALTPRFCLDTRAKKKWNINLNKYFISWNGEWTHPQPVDFTIILCAPPPRLASIFLIHWT